MTALTVLAVVVALTGACIIGAFLVLVLVRLAGLLEAHAFAVRGEGLLVSERLRGPGGSARP